MPKYLTPPRHDRSNLGRVYQEGEELMVLVQLPADLNGGSTTVTRVTIDRSRLDPQLAAAVPPSTPTPDATEDEAAENPDDPAPEVAPGATTSTQATTQTPTQATPPEAPEPEEA